MPDCSLCDKKDLQLPDYEITVEPIKDLVVCFDCVYNAYTSVGYPIKDWPPELIQYGINKGYIITSIDNDANTTKTQNKDNPTTVD